MTTVSPYLTEPSDYEALKAYGFSPAKAVEIQLDAARGDNHAKAAIGLARAAQNEVPNERVAG